MEKSISSAITLVFYLVCMVILISGPAFADDPAEWVKNVDLAGDILKDAAWGNNIYAVVGTVAEGSGATGGIIMTSDDRVAWNISYSGNVCSLVAIVWNGNKFVAVGKDADGNGRVITSQDGLNWTVHSQLIPGGGPESIAWDGFQFAGVGSTYIFTSDDGINWTYITSPASPETLSCIIWTGDMFIAVGSMGVVLTSPDGTTWTSRTSGITGGIIAVASDGSGLAAITSDRTIFYADASDPDAWTMVYDETQDGIPANLAAPFYDIVWGGDSFLATNIMGLKFISSDGTDWSPVYVGGAGQVDFKIACGGGLYIITGRSGTIQTSPDGIKWTTRASGVRNFRLVMSNGDLFIAATFYGRKYISYDGLSWTFTHSPDRMSRLLRIIWSNGQFFALHDDNGISRSEDAVEWTHGETIVVDEMVNPGMNAIVWNGMTYVAAGEYGYIYTSSDCATWTEVSRITTGNLRDIAWGAGNFVIVSSGHYDDPFPVILVSPDGANWTEADPKTASPLYSIMWEDNQFVAQGRRDGTKVVSPDGIEWTDVSVPVEYPPFNALCEEKEIVVGVGSSGYIAYSTDLINWTKCDPIVGDHLTSIASDGTQFIAVGSGSLIRNTGLLSGGGNGTLGDVNGDGTIDIVDALLTAQYYVGLNPAGFNPDAADVDCNGSVDIVDALLIARYYVGIITEFPCTS